MNIINFPRYENETKISSKAGLDVLNRIGFYNVKTDKIIMISSDDVTEDVKNIKKYNIFNCQYGYSEFYDELKTILTN